MGFTPNQIGDMSMWQFNVIWSAFVASKTGEEGSRAMTAEDMDAASAMIDGGAQWTK